jgi:hypothetical protein
VPKPVIIRGIAVVKRLVSALVRWIILMALLSGCASESIRVPLHVIPASEEARAELASVGVVSARFIPDARFDLPITGWGAGAARGAKIGVGGLWGIWLDPPGAEFGGSGDGLALALLLALEIALTPPVALVGSIVGAIIAEPVSTVEQAEAALKRILAEAKIQEVLRDHVLALAQKETHYSLVALADWGPTDAGTSGDYRLMSNTEVSFILEVGISAVELKSPNKDWAINPSLTVRILAVARIVRRRDNATMYTQTFECTGSERTFTEWASNNAQKLREVFEGCYDTVADQVVENAFLLYPLPELRIDNVKKPAP